MVMPMALTWAIPYFTFTYMDQLAGLNLALHHKLSILQGYAWE
jgi:hypothetical protein